MTRPLAHPRAHQLEHVLDLEVGGLHGREQRAGIQAVAAVLRVRVEGDGARRGRVGDDEIGRRVDQGQAGAAAAVAAGVRVVAAGVEDDDVGSIGPRLRHLLEDRIEADRLETDRGLRRDVLVDGDQVVGAPHLQPVPGVIEQPDAAVGQALAEPEDGLLHLAPRGVFDEHDREAEGPQRRAHRPRVVHRILERLIGVIGVADDQGDPAFGQVARGRPDGGLHRGRHENDPSQHNPREDPPHCPKESHRLLLQGPIFMATGPLTAPAMASILGMRVSSRNCPHSKFKHNGDGPPPLPATVGIGLVHRVTRAIPRQFGGVSLPRASDGHQHGGPRSLFSVKPYYAKKEYLQ
jgi:hypothetical protein